MGTCAQEPAAAPDCTGSAPRRGPDEPAASPSGEVSLAVSALAWENGPVEAVHVSYPLLKQIAPVFAPPSSLRGHVRHDPGF